MEEILKNSNLSVTDTRKKILNLFLSRPGALSHHDIETKTGQKFDRVTIYRTLQTFLEKGIIHSIPTETAVHYALCKENCSQGHHHHNHVHFVCEQCGDTTCLDDTSIPVIALPNGFVSKQVEMVVNGVCPNCKQSAE